MQNIYTDRWEAEEDNINGDSAKDNFIENVAELKSSRNNHEN